MMTKTIIDDSKPILCDYLTGTMLQNATPEELAASKESAEHDGGCGIITVCLIDCYVQD